MNGKLVQIILLIALIMPVSSLSSQWLQLDAPGSGRATSVVVCGTDLFAGFYGGGIFRSADNGTSWKEVTHNLRSRYVTSLFVSGSTLFAGASGSVYRYCDKGCSWTELNNGLPESTGINGFAEIGTNLFVATTHGVFLSKDQGQNWKPANSGLGNPDVACLYAIGKDLYAGSRRTGIYKSADNGTSWFRASAGLIAKDITAFASIGDRIFAGSTNGVYVSYNNGGYWAFREIGINQVTALAVNGSTIIAGGQCNDGSVLAMSTDAGDNWISISDGIMSRNIKSIVFKGSRIIVGCNYTGLCMAENPLTGWKHINNGIKAASISAMALDNDNLYCATQGSGIYFSKDNGKTWSQRNKGLKNGFVHTLLVRGSDLYAGTLSGAFCSSDQGNSWKEVLETMPVYSMAYDKDRIFAGCSGRIYKSHDNGGSWYNVGYGLPSNATVNSIQIKGKNVYAATSEGLFLSMSSSSQWKEISNGLPDKNIRSMAFYGSAILVGTNGKGLWMSVDNGEKWVNISRNQPLINVECIAVHGNTIVAASGNCLYRSFNQGKYWDCVATDFPLVRISQLACNSNSWFAGLDGAGIWRASLCEILKPPVPDTLTVLYANDSHSNLAPLGPRTKDLKGTRGGIARLATAIGMNKMNERNLLILHAGDAFTGDLFFNDKLAGAELHMLKSLGVDAFCLGNHEFDITSAGLLEVLKGTFPNGNALPLLSANLILPEELKELNNYVKPYIIKKVGGLRIGIFGLTTPEANVTSFPSPAFVDTTIIESASAIVQTLKENKSDVIILLSHLGLYLDKMLAEYIPGINVIVGGHDHYLLNAPVEVINSAGEKTYIVQAQSHYQALGKLRLLSGGGELRVLDNTIIHLNESVPEEPAVKAVVDELITEVEKMYGPVYSNSIGTAAAFFEEVADSLMYEGQHDTPVGNLLADALRDKIGTDISIVAGGSTAQPIFKGPLVEADAFRAIGYGFNLGYRVARFCITGADLWRVLEQVLATIEMNDELLPQVSGIQYTYNPTNAPGSRLVSVKINGKPIDPEVTYPAAANEFLVGVLTQVMGVPLCKVQIYEDLTEYQVLSAYISKMKTISPVVEGRILASTKKALAKDIAEANGLPVDYQLMQNSPNPFNPATTIEFAIPRDENVVLKIYNTLGQEVETLVNENMNAGIYKYTWTPKNLASGIYIYHLNAGKFSQAKKLVLMK